ncbi:DUF2207 domain-containing protein [Methanobrevibacter sp.]|uniref:DUF2207 domain-containing protein n=1 Tax=Methanobrevibacter sp. TaxID=66852 RepID=UPI0026DF3AB7|nr:DUF2207 domain-containing protein [Methanobrevibacter sp.]MDO5824173.1 DUF2207 domain-containing protein [Methanobrevibacter sp.]
MTIRKTFCIIMLFLILFSTLSCVSADDDDRSYSITHAFVDLTVGKDGLLHVEEEYDYSFDGAFNGVYRDIPLKSGESIENIKVDAQGAYPVLKEIDDDDGYKHLKIYLYSDAAHTQGIKDCNVKIYISYDMTNVVTLFNDIGALQFKLWGEEWDVGADKLTASIHLPGDSGNEYFLNPQEYNETSSINNNTITAESNSIPKGEFYELLVLMPLTDFDDNAAYAKNVDKNGREMILKNLEDSINERNFWSVAYIILGLLTLISPISALFIYLRYGREPEVAYDGIYERDLPTDDPPEIVNALIENKKEIGTPNMKGFEASIMNLIDKKAITLDSGIDEDSEMSDLLLKFNSKEGLTDSEKIVYDALHNFSTNDMLNLSSFSNKLTQEDEALWFNDKVHDWEASVKDEINIQKYFDDTGSTIINIMGILGIIYAIIIAPLGFYTNLSTGFFCVVAGIALGIFSFAIIMMDEDIFGRWTEEGRTYYLKWNNLKSFLIDNSLIKEHPPESIVIWKEYLIYGAALGVAEEVYESMKLQMPNISEFDDDIIRYHYYGGYGMMSTAFITSETTNSYSDSSDFGNIGGGSGGGGGGAF